MNDKQFDELFDQTIPPVDEDAKKIAINSAMSEFYQGFEQSARPITNQDNWLLKTIKSIGSFIMTPQKNSRFGATFASIAVAFIALSVFILLPNRQETNDLVVLETASEEDTISNGEVGLEQKTAISNTAEPKAQRSTVTNATKRDETRLQDINKKEIVVTANRQVIQNPIVQKRIEPQIVDGLSADEIGDIPELSVGEALTTITAAPTSKSLTQVKQRSVIKNELTIAPPQRPDSGEEYADYKTNPVKLVREEPVSTFSIDVDTASYSLVRNQLNNGFLPKPQAVRVEEFINYFDYNYPIPNSKKQPFGPTITVLNSPWNQGKKLVHIGIKGYELSNTKLPDSNLVFLLDVSGSMSSANKLPLVKQSINLLLDTLKPSDTVSIVVYAGAAGVVLEPTEIKNKTAIQSALQRLNAGGSTAGGQGIKLAYQLAEQNFDKDSVNRIILATDGDFNVGQSSNEDLKTLIERKRDNGIFLSVLGFGRNNYQDDMMQTLAQNGNGVAAYIDTLSEAKKVLVDEATSTLFTIAKDVKIQIEFNPQMVSEYRLVGYETRALKREDFNNDKVDAGDIGAGHTVTAIYEITPTDSESPSIDKPRYAGNDKAIAHKGSREEYGFLKIRYKAPNGTQSKLIEEPINFRDSQDIKSDVHFSIAVAGFAQLLTNNNYTGDLSYQNVIESAQKYKGQDEFGYRAEFIQLIRMAEIAKP